MVVNTLPIKKWADVNVFMPEGSVVKGVRGLEFKIDSI